MTNSFNKSEQPTEAAKAEENLASGEGAKAEEFSQPSLSQSPAANHSSHTDTSIKEEKDKKDEKDERDERDEREKKDEKEERDEGDMRDKRDERDEGDKKDKKDEGTRRDEKDERDEGDKKDEKDERDKRDEGDIRDKNKEHKNKEKKPTAKEVEIAKLKEELEQLEQLKQQLEEQLGQLFDSNLRLQAEIQNITRRKSLELEKAHKFGLESFAKGLIETVDNLEKSLAAITNKDDPIYQGVELTYQSLIATLAKFGVNQIDPQGEIFDPNFHEAIGRVQSPQHQTNRVVAVLEKGYMLYDRLLRPAKVQIAE